MNYEIIIIGGGPAGLAAAIEAREQGISRILVLERDRELGGILQQCIHNGFGLHIFKEELTGPEYAQRFIDRLQALEIEYRLGTMVLDITPDKEIHAVSREAGYLTFRAKAIILAMGCRERTAGAISLPGTRPAGILTAGTAQRYINMEGFQVGRRVVILGSGDIGLIMARRLTLEGAKVLAVVELLPFSGGLTRNIVQCLQDFDIPLYLSHTVVDVRGRERVSGVTIAEVDSGRRPIAGTERHYDCDTLLLSVGLIPENEISKTADIRLDPRTNGPWVNESMETSVPGIFACGNVVHVHDLVDFVTQESRRAGRGAARYAVKASVQQEAAAEVEPRVFATAWEAAARVSETDIIEAATQAERLSDMKTGQADWERGNFEIKAAEGVGYVIPQQVGTARVDDQLELFLRVRRVYHDARLVLHSGGRLIKEVRRRHLAPGEMEHVTLKKSELEAIADGVLTVEIKEDSHE